MREIEGLCQGGNGVESGLGDRQLIGIDENLIDAVAAHNCQLDTSNPLRKCF
jgi:hypothetical protein